jgi:hypothetical protein
MSDQKKPAHRPRIYSGHGAPKLTLRLPPDALARVMERGGATWARQVILDALDTPAKDEEPTRP